MPTSKLDRTYFSHLFYRRKEKVSGRLEVWGEGTQTMYTHVSKCKNDKIKGERKMIKRKT
jgi:hypothetical protein